MHTLRSTSLRVRQVHSRTELGQFISLPRQIYRGDRFWVPPLGSEVSYRLDTGRNPFWRTASRALFIACGPSGPVGRIAAIIDRTRGPADDGRPFGSFGFFECIDDEDVARALIEAASSWLEAMGMAGMDGPYNPSRSDEIGVLTEGFESAPALLEAHGRPYYPRLLERAGLEKKREIVARLWKRESAGSRFEDAAPEKLLRVARMVEAAGRVTVRPVRLSAWDEEISTACRLYNRSLAGLPEHLPVSQEQFSAFAASFKPYIDPETALIAEVDGVPAGFALALPDLNQALAAANGRLFPTGIIAFLRARKRITRATFKILVVLPEFRSSGAEAMLVSMIARAIWDRGYLELDSSLTGDENDKSNRFQDNLGMRVYRRYAIYSMEFGGAVQTGRDLSSCIKESI
jgi:GNAT superfamily N-acetyltransferase